MTVQQNVDVFHEDGDPLGSYPFDGDPLVGDVFLAEVPGGRFRVLVSVVSRRWTQEGKLQLIVEIVEIDRA